MGLLNSVDIGPLLDLHLLHILTYLLLTYIFLTWSLTTLYNIYFHPLRHFPGPKLWLIFPLLRHIDSITGTREHKIVAHHVHYGPVVRSAPDTLTFTDPQAWTDIYGHGRNPELPKALGVGRRQREPVPDILFADATTHARYRRALLPAFSERALDEQQGLIKVYIDSLMKRLGELTAKGEAADMTRWFNFTTFDLIGDLTFGEPLGGLESSATNVWLERIRAEGFAVDLVLREYLPGVGIVLGLLFKRSSRQHQAMVKSLVQRRIRNAEYGHRGDFMDQMMRGRGKDEQLTDDELTVNADILMIAGSETTATLLTGVVYFLLSNPNKMERLKQEIRDAFASKDDMTFAATTARLPYLLACLNEAMRLYPPVPVAVLRQTLPGAPVPIAGHLVPEKTNIGVHHLAAYHSPTNFHRPTSFLPERWLSETTTDPSSPFYHDRRDVHKPFSHGPRDCLGRSLAYHEMRLVLARLLWEFDLGLHQGGGKGDGWGWSEKQRTRLFWDKPPLWVDVRRRDGA